MCFNRYLLPKCGCEDASTLTKINDSAPVCKNISQVQCDFKVFRDFFSGDVEERCSEDW
jgi:hypothetical protein